MTLDQRARQAAQDARAAVRDSGGGASIGRSDRFQKVVVRRQRNQRIGVAIVAIAIAISSLVILTKAFGHRTQPAVPEHLDGLVVFVAGPRGEDPSHLYTMNPDGSDVHEIAAPVGYCYRWSPDGTKLATSADTMHGARPATMHPDGSGFTVLDATTDNINLACPAWSPDGRRLALEGWNDQDPSVVHGIYTVRASDGGDLQLLTGAGICPCDYSPDGTRIAFQAGANQLGVMNTDGTGLHLVTPRRFVSYRGLSWSPDGRWIVFNRPGWGGLYVVHPNGTKLRHIAPAGAGRGVRASSPDWSPDGTQVIFSMYTAATNEVDLYTARPDGSGLVRVTGTPFVDERGAAWGPPD
jgi:Tol biopolymer transport system component